jgi:HD-GYP domain-containing protein (c-di-GMP phosphodiesterase class II)
MNENNNVLARILPVPELSIKDAVQLLTSFVQAVNPELGQHMMQVALLTRQVGKGFGLEAQQLDQIEMAAMIHDIGLLGLPRELQNKDDRLLTEEQYRLYCQHPVIASIALEGVEQLAPVGEIVLHHHEYMNGKGFPNGLSGDQIPLGSRILLAVSDYCRIITSWPRNMRQLVSHARRQLGAEDWKRFAFSDDPENIIQASAERLLLKNAENRYDPEVVRALIGVIHQKNNIDPAEMIRLDDLKAGMVLMDDLRLEGGRLLITKGSKLVDATVQTLQGWGARGLIPHEVYVAKPEQTG